MLDLVLWILIVEMLRQSSDMAVILGVFLLTVILIGNYFLINYLDKQVKNK